MFTLERWTRKRVIGIRLSTGERSTGKNPLAIWHKASELGLVVSYHSKVEEFASNMLHELVATLPKLPIVIKHLARIGQGAKPPYTVFRRALRLAEYPNTYIKVVDSEKSAPGQLSCDRHSGLIIHLTEMAIDTFGARRMMCGSDFPPVSNREGYRNAINGVMWLNKFGRREHYEWVMGKTASSVFGLS